ncbi:NAD(P)-dependent dehydrogenase (short-subunit alcohol dehydrogenase family) [Halopolyspora algeriensis]|uniref:NAD(P)-dependent dehydrogenase (Short-subunit alcohol dehydrogenase family) n=1 Tax=Halopolyspora algeriensis TaxID=1500506 RepID=A0A368VYK4_9ACTN|nr:SDR family oxidoreductase [Halopolyspora algeriensis]RCW47298.1 NAD(P)-dependent dehydrogenase (short-subunit alcohol dehydrogenase family) [Halopolyspora algeriensis]TQM42533.1 NAD(P)-dependent dehydrogenase (short-subunit alcohol dehydrogenase family) [Halopolyspora algeriensis]
MSTDPFSLHGTTALVTGAGRGIGFQIARALSNQGARVVVGEIDHDNGPRAAEEIDGEFVPLDVTDSGRIAETVEYIVSTYGALDVSVHNAGMVRNEPAESMSDESWREVLGLNLDAVFYCCRETGKAMLRQGSGSIVNIASMSGIISNHPQAQVSYNASKAGVITLTKSLAGEWASRGVRVNSISPGYIGTDLLKQVEQTQPEWFGAWMEQTPMGRVGEPHELGPLAVFLASEASSFMTGSNVVADGGFTSW